MKEISIDLVICTYNNAKLLKRTLEAIANQIVSPEVKWEVIVVNNNCTDETLAIVNNYLKLAKFPLKMVLEPIQGLTPARLCGVKNSSGEWIAFIDDDCLIAKDWVQQAAIFALYHPECGGFGGKVILDWEIVPPDYMLNFGYCFAQQDYGENSQKIPCVVGAGMVLKRSALDKVGWIKGQFLADRVGKKLISGGDVEIGLRIASQYDLWYNPLCKLDHQIPSHRISLDYLYKINIGLGKSKLLGDSLIWSNSYFRWLIVSIAYGLRDIFKLLIWELQNITWRKSFIEISIHSRFVLGWWLGIGQLFCWNHKERKALLGCAKIN